VSVFSPRPATTSHRSCSGASPPIPTRYAQELYAQLREFDGLRRDLILVVSTARQPKPGAPC
jgi:hypothetical protein